MDKGRRCEAQTISGRQCRGWAVRGTDPPRCALHGGRLPTTDPALHARLAGQIADLDARIARLGAYIDGRAAPGEGELEVGDLCRLNDLYSKMLGRVTRMRQALKRLDPAAGEAQSTLIEAYNKALDDVAREREIEL